MALNEMSASEMRKAMLAEGIPEDAANTIIGEKIWAKKSPLAKTVLSLGQNFLGGFGGRQLLGAKMPGWDIGQAITDIPTDVINADPDTLSRTKHVMGGLGNAYGIYMPTKALSIANNARKAAGGVKALGELPVPGADKVISKVANLIRSNTVNSAEKKVAAGRLKDAINAIDRNNTAELVNSRLNNLGNLGLNQKATSLVDTPMGASGKLGPWGNRPYGSESLWKYFVNR